MDRNNNPPRDESAATERRERGDRDDREKEKKKGTNAMLRRLGKNAWLRNAAAFSSESSAGKGREVMGASVHKVSRSTDDAISISQPGQAFMNDTRSTCGVGVGDGISNHTAKWIKTDGKTPIEYCQSAEPVRVRGLSVACTGLDGEDAFELGSPVQFISLKGTSRERPAVCKYTGRKWWSDDWRR